MYAVNYNSLSGSMAAMLGSSIQVLMMMMLMMMMMMMMMTMMTMMMMMMMMMMIIIIIIIRLSAAQSHGHMFESCLSRHLSCSLQLLKLIRSFQFSSHRFPFRP